MTRRPPHLNIFHDRHGKLRCYFRRRGKTILVPMPGQPGFENAYAAALVATQPTSAGTPRTGTLSALIAAYYSSSDFRTLRESTRRGYRSMLESLRTVHGHKLVADLEPRHVRALIAEKSENPAAANKLRRFLKMLMRFAVANEWRATDPTVGIKKLRNSTAGHPDWPDGEVQKYLQFWTKGSKQHLAIMLFLYTGQRLGDVARMSVNHLEGDLIRVRQSKTQETLLIPLHAELKAAIQATPRKGLYLLETQTGRPYSDKSLGQTFVDWARRAGVSHGYSAHGLRKSSLRSLADAGATLPQLMAVSGHRDPDQALHYIRARDQRAYATAAIQLLSKERNKN